MCVCERERGSRHPLVYRGGLVLPPPAVLAAFSVQDFTSSVECLVFSAQGFRDCPPPTGRFACTHRSEFGLQCLVSEFQAIVPPIFRFACIQHSGISIQRSGINVQGSVFSVQGLVFSVQGLVVSVWALVLRVRV